MPQIRVSDPAYRYLKDKSDAAHRSLTAQVDVELGVGDDWECPVCHGSYPYRWHKSHLKENHGYKYTPESPDEPVAVEAEKPEPKEKQ